jgi:hypothetical protein
MFLTGLLAALVGIVGVVVPTLSNKPDSGSISNAGSGTAVLGSNNTVLNINPPPEKLTEIQRQILAHLDRDRALNKARLNAVYPRGYAYFFVSNGGEVLGDSRGFEGVDVFFTRPRISREADGSVKIEFAHFSVGNWSVTNMAFVVDVERFCLADVGPNLCLWAEHVEDRRDGVIVILGVGPRSQ